MSRIALFLLTFILLCCVFAAAQIPDQAKVVAGSDRAVEKAAKLSPPNAPGCAVGVSLDGKSVYEKGFGMADLEYDIPITPKTIFEFGLGRKAIYRCLHRSTLARWQAESRRSGPQIHPRAP
jgi:CubicO group peptidase (beta-lactamase class C family)